MEIDQQQAQTLFDAGGFFILPLERPGQEFGIDGNVWAVKSFAGIKFLPPGLHLFLYSSPPSVGGRSTPFGGEITIRKGIFRITKPKEVVVRKYDEAGEEVTVLTSKKRKLESEESSRGEEASRLDRHEDAPASEDVEDTIVSKDYLKSLDPKLAPYPFKEFETWKSLTGFISQTTLETVLGVDRAGDARCDALMASATEIKEGETNTSPTGKKYWGKSRQSIEDDEMANVVSEDQSGRIEGLTPPKSKSTAMSMEPEPERVLNFAVFDLKRSWATGASAEEITRDSRDKSWLLGHILETELKRDFNELLAQIQLAFVLFTQLHNISALECYKRFLALLSRSSSLFINGTAEKSSQECLEFYFALVKTVLVPQLNYLRIEFFQEDLPGLEPFLLEEFGHLRMALRSAYRELLKSSSIESLGRLKSAWKELQDVGRTKFGWMLGGLEAEDLTTLQGKKGKVVYNLLAQADEEDEYVEEGEDAPVVVDL